jgi:hypothetical protein
VRGRGIDTVALDYLAAHHDPSDVVFVDGWTGKGAIARELAAALADYRATTGVHFDPELAVLADPGRCVRTFGTRDDFLIPSACLNSTVSGLISRTVLNDRLLGPGDYHGAKFYAELAGSDVSGVFLEAISDRFAQVAPGRAGPPSNGSARSTASGRSTSSSRGSARPPGCCCAGFRSGCWCARGHRPTSRTCWCWRLNAAFPSRRSPTCRTHVSA